MAAFRKSPGVAVLLEVGDCNTASRLTHTQYRTRPHIATIFAFSDRFTPTSAAT